MSTQRVFTVAEVEALIPKLSELVGAQMTLQSEIQQQFGELARKLGEVPRSLEPAPSDTLDVKELRMQLKRQVLRFDSGWRKVQALGAVVKDQQIGLVDFYGHVDGRLVWLCWRYGEDTLGYYHDLEAGYSGRRPLGGDTRARLIN